VILRIVLVNFSHGIGIGARTLFVIEFVGVGVEDLQRTDVFLLARRGSFQFRGSRKQFCAALQTFCGRRIPELMIEAHGLAPFGHGALGVSGCNFFEGLLRFFVLEGVE